MVEMQPETLKEPRHFPALGKKLVVKSITSILSRYYLRFYVIDKPSVLAFCFWPKISESGVGAPFHIRLLHKHK